MMKRTFGEAVGHRTPSVMVVTTPVCWNNITSGAKVDGIAHYHTAWKWSHCVPLGIILYDARTIRQEARIPFGLQFLSHTRHTLLTQKGRKLVATSVYVTHDVMVNYPQRSRSGLILCDSTTEMCQTATSWRVITGPWRSQTHSNTRVFLNWQGRYFRGVLFRTATEIWKQGPQNTVASEFV